MTEPSLQRLLDENRRLTEVVRAKDQFIATLSHELRNQLHVIQGWMAMLKTGNLSSERSEHAMRVIDRSLQAQHVLLEDLLDLSAALQGKLTLTPQSVDLGLFVREALQACAPAVAAKSLALQSDIDPRLPLIQADSNRLRQAFLNLMGNAIKFTPREGTIRVSTRALSGQVELTVSDSGLGIPREFLPHVFEAFQQAGSMRGERATGLGMGLAIVKHIVDLHGGEISAQSAGEGRGSTFRVLLPALSENARTDCESQL